MIYGKGVIVSARKENPKGIEEKLPEKESQALGKNHSVIS